MSFFFVHSSFKLFKHCTVELLYTHQPQLEKVTLLSSTYPYILSTMIFSYRIIIIKSPCLCASVFFFFFPFFPKPNSIHHRGSSPTTQRDDAEKHRARPPCSIFFICYVPMARCPDALPRREGKTRRRYGSSGRRNNFSHRNRPHPPPQTTWEYTYQ